MGFTNYLTSYKLHLLKHIKGVFTFSDTSKLNEAEVKSYVSRLTHESAIPIPNETFEWLANYFKYIEDKDNLFVYDNITGLWTYEDSDNKMRNVLTDYFTIISELALAANDQIMYRYANYFFGVGKIPNLVSRIKTAIIYMIRKSADIVKATENYRYFETTDGTRALLDMSKPKFNLKTVKFQDTQPLMLTSISPVPISTTDEEPTLWLSLIEEYMLHDQARIEYFHKVLAYMMAPYNYNQVLLYFIGDGRNGKGTVVKVLQDILGSHAIRMNAELLNAQPAPSFKKDDALAATEGRSLLIFNEIDERMVASTQNIKDLTEGGRDEFGNKIMTVVRPAYSRNYEVNICGTPLIIANSLINFGDWSALDPIFKRLVLVPFDFKIVNEDPDLLNKLAQEYPKIQTWLYLNYFKHKGIRLKTVPKPPAIENKFIQYRADSDIIGTFWKDCIEFTQNTKDEMLRSDLYRMYEQYCKANGRKAIKNKGTNGFQNLIESYLARATVVHKNGSFYVQGIKRTQYFDNEIKFM
jgi:P4 family phage/plasmid primase-like protien